MNCGAIGDAKKDEIDMIELMEQENDEKTEKEAGGYRNGFILIFVKHQNRDLVIVWSLLSRILEI